MAYEIWDAETANLLGAFETESEAMEVVREALHAHGPAYVESLFLGYENARGRSRMIADGKTLIERATNCGDDIADLSLNTAPHRTRMAG